MARYRIIVNRYDIWREYISFECTAQKKTNDEWRMLGSGNTPIRLRLADVRACLTLAGVRDLLIAQARELADVRRENTTAEIIDRLPELPVIIDIGEV